MKIIFIANNGQNTVSADTAQLAALGFLERYKNRTFSIQEWRDGRFFFEVFGDGDPEKNCFHVSFKSRAEAQAFVDAQQALAA